jgi:hypothetical protein
MVLELQELHELQRVAHVKCYPAGTVVPLHCEEGRPKLKARGVGPRPGCMPCVCYRR